MFEILEVTAQYSNAVLLAVLPFVSDFARKADLPLAYPVTIGQVAEFKCSPRVDLFGGRVVLTNGYEFAFVHGHIEMFRSPNCFYELQDATLVPKFFGLINLSQNDAVAVARRTIRKLGYDEEAIGSHNAPKILSPLQVGSSRVARYRVWWESSTDATRTNATRSADFEIDATTGRIHLMYLLHPSTYREPPTVDVKPPVIGTAAQNRYQGGRAMTAVTAGYSNAFLRAILPQCSDYIQKAGFQVSLPIKIEDVNLSRYICSLVDEDPMAVVDLKSGARFVYRHGQVIAFYEPDVMQLPGEESSKAIQQFFGSVRINSNEAIDLVKSAIRKLGYSEKALHLDEPPQINPPVQRDGGTIARYVINWKQSRNGPFRVVAEVDAEGKKLKSLYINDHANTNIWRQPPRVSH